MHVNIPSPKQSIFNIPIASTSSLSHSTTVRSVIAARSRPGPPVQANIRTCGDYVRDGDGTATTAAGIDVDDTSFKYVRFSGCCGNPDTDGTSSDTPNNCGGTDQFYEIDFDVTADCEQFPS